MEQCAQVYLKQTTSWFKLKLAHSVSAPSYTVYFKYYYHVDVHVNIHFGFRAVRRRHCSCSADDTVNGELTH